MTTLLMPEQADLLDEELQEEEESSEVIGADTAIEAEAADQPPEPAIKLTAKEAAERILSWAQEHHLLDTLAVTSHATPAEAPDDGTLFKAQGQMIHSLRTKQVAGVIYSEGEKTVYVLTRKRLSATAQKNMPGWHSGVTVKYIHFGQAQTGGNTQPSDGQSYRDVQSRYSCGSSIHPARYPGAGTIGCLIKDADGQMYGLTANHVSGLANYADEGEKILAPGHSDITPKGRDPFTIGVHVRALPMNHGSPTNVNIDENTDAAIFMIRQPDAVSSSQGGYYDTPAIHGEPKGGMLVEKVGRTTGYTNGKIMGLSPSPVAVSYQLPAVGGNATVYFNNLITVIGENGTPFSMGGDSGSLVVGQAEDGTHCAVGMVIAGTNTGYSLILPIGPILETLGMTLVSNHNT